MRNLAKVWAVPVAALGLVAALYAVSQATLMRGFAAVENDEVSENTHRATAAFMRELGHLGALARQWAQWDYTYAFVQGRNPAYRRVLNTSTLKRLGVSTVAYLDQNGRIVWQAGLNSNGTATTPLHPELASYLALASRVLASGLDPTPQEGFLVVHQAPMLIARHPILRSDGSGPAAGVLILGKLLTPADMDRLARITHLRLAFIPSAGNGAQLPARSVVPEGPDTIVGYASLADLHGKPALTLKVICPRPIWRQGSASLAYFMLCVAAIVVASVAGILLLFRRLVASLTQHREALYELHEVATRARCILWLADIDAQTDGNGWTIRVPDEAAAQRIIPLNVSQGQTYAEALWQSMAAGDQVQLAAAREKTVRLGQASYRQEFRCYTRDGELRWLLEDVVMLPRGPGRWRAVGFCTDITERKEAEQALRGSEERFRALVRNTSDVVAIVDQRGSLKYVSPASSAVWGHAPEALRGEEITSIVHPNDVAKLRALLDRTSAEPNATQSGEVRFLHPNGVRRLCEVVLSNQLCEPGIMGVVLTCRDITERKAVEEQLAHQAFHDALTGLPNRTLFMERVGRALARTHRSMKPVAVLFLDLDAFKLVNDSLGHDAGDELLQVVAERLKECVRSSDTVARIGGDEFVILLEDLEGHRHTVEVAERIAKRLDDPVLLKGRTVFVTASIGIATNGPDGCQPEDLLRDAGTAMYWAKGSGKAKHVVFDPEMNTLALERLELDSDLRRGLENGEFVLHYQPIVDLATGHLQEVEALVRWQHPERGLLYPGSFIAIAEERGIIVPLGMWVLEEACRQQAQWLREDPEGAPAAVSVNLSARHLLEPDLVECVARVLEKTGLDPKYLTLEITESVMLQDTQTVLVQLQGLKSLGIRLAVDDFGTGYSSMSYLSSFPVDTLKIDRSFVQRIGYEQGDEAIVRAMVLLARSLNLGVTSEGVETDEQRNRLRAMGCELGQGYLFCKPVPSSELGEWLKARRLRPAAAAHE